MATQHTLPDSKQRNTPRPVYTIDEILDMYKADMPELPDLPIEPGEFKMRTSSEGDMLVGFIGILVILNLIIMVFSCGSFWWSKWKLETAREQHVAIRAKHDSLVAKFNKYKEKQKKLLQHAQEIQSLQQQVKNLNAEGKKVQAAPTSQNYTYQSF